jgi:hypothetical protein
VMQNGRHTGEWAPARQQPRKRANTVDRATGRPPAVPGMRAVRDGQGWAYEPIIRTGPADAAETRANATKCGAPTADTTPCERLGDCPIPKHKTWRARNGR